MGGQALSQRESGGCEGGAGRGTLTPALSQRERVGGRRDRLGLEDFTAHDRSLISLMSGMKRAITMKPTAPPRKMISKGSIRLVRLSVSTATSSS